MRAVFDCVAAGKPSSHNVVEGKTQRDALNRSLLEKIFFAAQAATLWPPLFLLQLLVAVAFNLLSSSTPSNNPAAEHRRQIAIQLIKDDATSCVAKRKGGSTPLSSKEQLEATAHFVTRNATSERAVRSTFPFSLSLSDQKIKRGNTGIVAKGHTRGSTTTRNSNPKRRRKRKRKREKSKGE